MYQVHARISVSHLIRVVLFLHLFCVALLHPFNAYTQIRTAVTTTPTVASSSHEPLVADPVQPATLDNEETDGKHCCSCIYETRIDTICEALPDESMCSSYRSDSSPNDPWICVWNALTKKCQNNFRKSCDAYFADKACDSLELVPYSPSLGSVDLPKPSPIPSCSSHTIYLSAHGEPSMCTPVFDLLTDIITRAPEGCTEVKFDANSCQLASDTDRVTDLAWQLCTRTRSGQTCTVSGTMCDAVMGAYSASEIPGCNPKFTVCIGIDGVTATYPLCPESCHEIQTGQIISCKQKATDPRPMLHTCCRETSGNFRWALGPGCR